MRIEAAILGYIQYLHNLSTFFSDSQNHLIIPGNIQTRSIKKGTISDRSERHQSLVSLASTASERKIEPFVANNA
jgi:hypothetical protein